MSSLLHAFILLFYVVQNLFCGEAGRDVAEGGRLHSEVLLRRGGGGREAGGGGRGRRRRGGCGRGGRRQWRTSPPLRGRRAQQRVEIQSPFQSGPARHGRSAGLGRGGEGGREGRARKGGRAGTPSAADPRAQEQTGVWGSAGVRGGRRLRGRGRGPGRRGESGRGGVASSRQPRQGGSPASSGADPPGEAPGAPAVRSSSAPLLRRSCAETGSLPQSIAAP